jgi:hypothetical protein
MVPVSYEFIDIKGLEFEKGRFYNETEANSGANVIVFFFFWYKGIFYRDWSVEETRCCLAKAMILSFYSG